MGSRAVAQLAAAADLAKHSDGDAQLADGLLHLGVVKVGFGHELVQCGAKLGVGEVGAAKGFDLRQHGGGDGKDLVEPRVDAPKGGEQDHAGDGAAGSDVQRQRGAHRVADKNDAVMVAVKFVQGMFDRGDPVGVAALGQFGDGLAEPGEEEALGRPARFMQEAAGAPQLAGVPGKPWISRAAAGEVRIAVPEEGGMFGCLKGTQFGCQG